MSQKRAAKRYVVNIKASIVDTSGVLIGACFVEDVSKGGAKITNIESLQVPEKFDLMFTMDGKVRRHCEVVQRSETELGIKFVPPRSEQDQTSQHKIDA